MVGCTTSALVCTSCTHGVQENGAIGLVVRQSAEILGLIICFAIHFQKRIVQSAWSYSEILGLIICFAIHFLYVTIE